MNGMGPILHVLKGGSPKDPKDYYGKRINSISLVENKILIHFEGGVKIKIWDDAQTCCENRFITTSDDLKSLIGQKLIEIITKDAPDTTTEYGETHECIFLEIQGHHSSITFCTHNEHNGYYGGFGLSLDEITNC